MNLIKSLEYNFLDIVKVSYFLSSRNNRYICLYCSILGSGSLCCHTMLLLANCEKEYCVTT